jgi:endo-1,4-beta-xylanase
MEGAIEVFRPTGLIQAVTELDMAISYSDDEKLTNSIRKTRTELQGYFAKHLFEMLNRHHDVIVSVSFWGLHDGRTWLKHWPEDRPLEAPLLFDEKLIAKNAFWGMVDSSRLSDQLMHEQATGTVMSCEISPTAEVK